MGGHVGGVCAGPDQDEGPAPVSIGGGLSIRLDVVHQQTTKKMLCKLWMKKDDAHAV
jgi:hypothetical protein